MALNITRNIGEATEYNNFHIQFKLLARNTINAVTAFGGGCCCLGTQSRKTIIQKYFDDRLSSGFSERPEQLIDAVNEISPLVSQVIPSQSAKSHDL